MVDGATVVDGTTVVDGAMVDGSIGGTDGAMVVASRTSVTSVTGKSLGDILPRPALTLGRGFQTSRSGFPAATSAS